ncbi:hypothetical protein K6W38_09825 [Burkholderia contaminans]|nr:hypothetical protein [Burkholderia contaminans]
MVEDGGSVDGGHGGGAWIGLTKTQMIRRCSRAGAPCPVAPTARGKASRSPAAHTNEPSPPASHTAIASGLSEPTIGAWINGNREGSVVIGIVLGEEGGRARRRRAFNAPDINRQTRTPIAAPFTSRIDLPDSGKTIIHGNFSSAIPPSMAKAKKHPHPCCTAHSRPHSNTDSPVSMISINIQVIKYRRLPLLKTTQAIT